MGLGEKGMEAEREHGGGVGGAIMRRLFVFSVVMLVAVV